MKVNLNVLSPPWLEAQVRLRPKLARCRTSNGLLLLNNLIGNRHVRMASVSVKPSQGASCWTRTNSILRFPDEEKRVQQTQYQASAIWLSKVACHELNPIATPLPEQSGALRRE